MTAVAPTFDLPAKASIAPPSEPIKEWWVEVVQRSDLDRHVPAWEILAKNAVEPNAFYEPWMFLPATRAFDREKPIMCALIYRHDPRPKQPPQLCGFFPFERRGSFKGLPIRHLRLW